MMRTCNTNEVPKNRQCHPGLFGEAKSPPNDLLVRVAAGKVNLVVSGFSDLKDDAATVYSTKAIHLCDVPFVRFSEFSHAFDFIHDVYGDVLLCVIAKSPNRFVRWECDK